MARVTAESIEEIAEYARWIRQRPPTSAGQIPRVALASHSLQELAHSLASEAGIRESKPLLDNLGILLTARPVFLVNEAKAPSRIESLHLARLDSAADRAFDSAMLEMSRAVARVGVLFNNRRDWLGSAWLVADDLVVTSRHVAEIFAARRDTEFPFRSGGHPIFRQVPYVSFSSSSGAGDVDLRIDVQQVLYISPEGEADFAVLRLERPQPEARPIQLSSDSYLGRRAVFLVGYPARDPRESVATLPDRLFAGYYERKCLAAGTLLRQRDGTLFHDCLQLGDCSGAALLDEERGQAVGLHIDGRFLHEGRAVSAYVVASLLRDAPWDVPTVLTDPFADEPSPPAEAALSEPYGGDADTLFDLPGEALFQIPQRSPSAFPASSASAAGLAPPPPGHPDFASPASPVSAAPAASAPPAATSGTSVTFEAVATPPRQLPSRVLNANFRGPDGKLLSPRSPLIAGLRHTLLVDIGPLWPNEPGHSSIVTGEKGFREDVLPADGAGWPIEVVLLSDDFGPRQSSAWMWVPRGGGQSYPLRKRTSTPEGIIQPDSITHPDSDVAPGPVELTIALPPFPKNTQNGMRFAHGRLCLYYRNNLLQSARLRVSVAADDAVISVATDNVVDVDFVLNSGLVALDERYAQRQVRFEPDDEGTHAVGLNLALNDDGAGGHRIIVKRDNDTPLVGWSRFDPAAAEKFLASARQELLDCFFRRDPECEVVLDRKRQPLKGLDACNGKTHEQFRYDLTRLAEIGHGLFNKAFGQVVTESTSGLTPAAWMAQLRKALGEGKVIQVARTLSMPDHYVFPWGLVYEYPLTGPERANYKWCRVLGEWSSDGIRQQPPRRRCPFSDEPWHQENILCPYGFWGLKHIIEQPPSATWLDGRQIKHGDTYSEMPMTHGIAISMALTRDQQLDARAIGLHLDSVKGVSGVRLVPTDAAEDFDTVRAMLRGPQLAYFLCHCERDPVRNAFLSVGPRDGQPKHRIYADTLTDWSAAATPDTGFDRPAWQKNRPLVFINGCHTADLLPGDLVNFVSPFTGAGASGVVGTEISVQLPVAIEFAEQLFKRITQPVTPPNGRCVPLGEAMRETRWHFANKGNLLGLAYTFYSLANLQYVATPRAALS